MREAVSNAVRHANATTLTVTVKVEDELSIEVVDNGRGISERTKGSGLANMHYRAQQVGGTFTVDTALNRRHVAAVVRPVALTDLRDVLTRATRVPR